jgi:hypothetical protein
LPFKACVLHKALACDGTAYSTFHGAIAGPSACPAGVTVPEAVTPAPATSASTPAPDTEDTTTEDTTTAGATVSAQVSSAYHSQKIFSLNAGAILLAILLPMTFQF